MKTLLKLFSLAVVLALGFTQAEGQYVWTKDARNPILSGGPSGSWNRHVFGACVLYNTDSARYEMWFDADDGPPPPNWRPYRICFAVSPDGISWTMHPSPVLSPDPGTWDAGDVETPMVIRENGQYKMWYAGYGSSPVYYLGYATSADGIHWTKYAGNPIMGPGTAAWEANGPFCCSVAPFAGGYRMWYGAGNADWSMDCIGYAISADGINWQRDTVNNPVLNVGASGQWDDAYVTQPKVLPIGDTYYLWYLGARPGTPNYDIGLATSRDGGITWTKYPANPVLPRSAGAWDGGFCEPGSILLRGDTLDMWYDGSTDGSDNYPYRIGHATSPLTIIGITERQQEVPQHFMLCQNYPNPFNPSTTIRYELPKSSMVRLSVYDILGREVSALVNEQKSAGSYEVKFDGGGLSSGVYFYRIQAGDFVQAKKLIMVK